MSKKWGGSCPPCPPLSYTTDHCNPPSLTTPLPPSLTTPLPHSLTTPLTHSLTTPLPHSLTTPLPPSLTTPLPHSLTTPLPPSLTTPLPPSLTTPLYTPPSIHPSLPLCTHLPLQRHRAKGLLDLRQCKVYEVHPSLFGP